MEMGNGIGCAIIFKWNYNCDLSNAYFEQEQAAKKSEYQMLPFRMIGLIEYSSVWYSIEQ